MFLYEIDPNQNPTHSQLLNYCMFIVIFFIVNKVSVNINCITLTPADKLCLAGL